jgi:hypothetical protein
MTWRQGLKDIPPEGVLCIGYAYYDPEGTEYVGTIDELIKKIPSHELVWKLAGIGRMQLDDR